VAPDIGRVVLVESLGNASTATVGTELSTATVVLRARVLTANASPPATKTAVSEIVVAVDVFMSLNLMSA
jgi:hypothetical protein